MPKLPFWSSRPIVVSARYIPSTRAAKGDEMNTGGRGLRTAAGSLTGFSGTLGSPFLAWIRRRSFIFAAPHPEGAKAARSHQPRNARAAVPRPRTSPDLREGVIRVAGKQGSCPRRSTLHADRDVSACAPFGFGNEARDVSSTHNQHLRPSSGQSIRVILFRLHGFIIRKQSQKRPDH